MQNAGKQNNQSDQSKQKKQLIMMTGALALCAVLVTWTVLLLKDRMGEADTIEQTSQFEITQVNSAPETTAPVSGMWEDYLTEPLSTKATTGVTTTSDGVTVTTTRKLIPQTANFVKLTTKPAATTKKPAAPATTHTQQAAHNTTAKATVTTAKTTHAAPATSSTTAKQTTHTQTVTQAPQTTPPPAPALTPPSGAQILYNQLLAAYLGAGAQGGEAYYAEPAGSGQPTVILGNRESGYRGVVQTDQSVKALLLGGTGDGNENPWQTDAGFNFRKCENGGSFVFYDSEGSSHKVFGAFNPDSGDNIWTRIQYSGEEGAYKAEYHVYKKNASGAQSELLNGTGDTESLYAMPAELDAGIDLALQAIGIPAGDPELYPALAANSQGDIAAIRSRAGSYNNDFALQSGGMYGVIAANSDVVYLRAGMSMASNIIASLPAGTFVSVDSGYDPDSSGVWCPVSVFLNGTWQSGYVSAVYVLTWKAE